MYTKSKPNVSKIKQKCRQTFAKRKPNCRESKSKSAKMSRTYAKKKLQIWAYSQIMVSVLVGEGARNAWSSRLVTPSRHSKTTIDSHHRSPGQAENNEILFIFQIFRISSSSYSCSSSCCGWLVWYLLRYLVWWNVLVWFGLSWSKLILFLIYLI